MSKVLKKMKLNELQKENVGAKEMKSITGGYQCACGYSCGSCSEDVDDMYGTAVTQVNYCGC